MGDKIKQRILELVPDAGESFGIAVVLRAIHEHKENSVVVYSSGHFWEGGSNKNIAWNLSKDNYDDQTEETKKFIGELLTVV